MLNTYAPFECRYYRRNVVAPVTLDNRAALNASYREMFMPSYLTGCSGKLFTMPAIRPAANKFEPFHGCSSHTMAGFKFGLLILPATRAKKMHRAMHRRGISFRVYILWLSWRNGAISCLPRLGRSANFHPRTVASHRSPAIVKRIHKSVVALA